MQRIPDDSSLFTAEAKTVDLALDFMRTCDTNNKFITFSDSLSVLKAINHTSSMNPQIQKLLENFHELLANEEIVLCWIPRYRYPRELDGRSESKNIAFIRTNFFKIPFSNFKPSFNRYVLDQWHFLR